MLVQRESRKFIIFLFSWNLFAFLARLTSGVNVLHDIGFCGECYCIPSIGQACPGMELLPQVEFSNEFLNVLRAMTRNTTFSLNCDPYQSDDCNSDPPLEIGGACAVEILRPETSTTTTCPDQYSYRYVWRNMAICDGCVVVS